MDTREWGADAYKDWVNKLYYGDNLDVLKQHIGPESVDFVYLDPPFNSRRSYNILFARDHGADHAQAQLQAFDDTWTWTPETEETYLQLIAGAVPGNVSDALQAIHELIGENDVMAYLVMMAPRLVELRRVLKPTGTLALHCDDAASHYLKLLLDAIFDPRNFRNEVIWKRTSGHSDARRFGRVHDVILIYARGPNPKWNTIYVPYEEAYVEQYYRYKDPDGRRFMSGDLGAAGLTGGGYDYVWKNVRRVWRVPEETMKRLDSENRVFYTRNGIPRIKRYLDEAKGLPAPDVWTDIEALRSWHREKLRYPTQKPKALLDRLIEAFTDEKDLVLDPFCGCGTSVDAAQGLNRRWVGIDITYIAIDLIRRRLEDTYGDEAQFAIDGIPKDMDGARALFARSPFDFERWAVSMVNGQPNERQVGDRGSDGVIRFPLDRRSVGKALVSVKGGGQLNPAMVRDLLGTVSTQNAEMGVLITMDNVTRGMTEAANHAGNYEWPVNGQSYAKIQIVTVEQLFAEHRLNMPPSLNPYLEAPRNVVATEQMALDVTGRGTAVEDTPSEDIGDEFPAIVDDADLGYDPPDPPDPPTKR